METTIGLILAIAASFAAVESLSMQVSLLAFASAGIGICLTFLLLGAPSVALLLFVVESVILAALSRATSRDTSTESIHGREIAGYVMSILFITAALVVFYYAFKVMPVFGLNVIKIDLGLRGLDTIVMIAALLAASAGALAVLRKKGKSEH